MTRLTRTIIFGSFIFVPYILIWTSTLPVPFIDEKVKNELLAVVSYASICVITRNLNSERNLTTVSLVAARVVWFIFIMVVGERSIHVQ